MDNQQNINWMTIEEAADYLRCSQRYLREKVANREIPFCKFGGKILIYRERIDEWLLAQEVSPEQKADVSRDVSATESFNANTTILPDCDRKKIDELVQKLIDFKEHFVTSIGRNIKEDLERFNYEKLSDKVYAQLSRWCYPNRNTKREKAVRPIVHQISEILFGRVIERTKHPSYRG